MLNTTELDDRIAKCEKILQTDPNSQIFAALAEAHRRKGDLETAFRVCHDGLKVHPDYGSAHVVMAKVNLDQNQYDWAEAEAMKAARIDGHIRSVDLLLAEIHIYKGEFEKAIKLLKRLLASDSNNVQIRSLLALAWKIPAEQEKLVPGNQSFSTHEVQIPVVQNDSQHVPAPEQFRSERPESAVILQQAIAMPDVDGALFINEDGLIVESEWTLKSDAASCAAIIGGIGIMCNQELVQSSFGKVESVLIETGDPIYYIKKADIGMFLFVADGAAQLGGVRMKIDTLMDTYR